MRSVNETPSDPVEFRLFRGGETDLESLRPAWEAVEATLPARAYYQSYAWYDAFVRFLQPDATSMRYYVAYRSGKPTGVFPLRVARQRIAGVPLRVLEIPHHPHHWLSDLVFDPGESNAAMLRLLLQRARADGITWDVLMLPNVLGGAAAELGVTRLAAPLVLSEVRQGCDVLRCDTFKPPRKNNSKRNRLSREGTLEVRHVRDPSEIAEAMDEFIAVEGSGWKGEQGTAIRCDPSLVRFYHRIAENFARRGEAVVTLIRLDGRCIAASCSLRTGRTLYWLKHGYDEALAKYSPALLLFEDLVRHCVEQQDADVINFITDNDWHQVFGPQRLTKHSWFVFRPTPAGLAGYAATTLKRLARRAAQSPIVGRLRRKAPASPAKAPATDEA